VGSLRQRIYKALCGLQLRATVLLGVMMLLVTWLTGTMYVRLSETLTLSQTQRHASDLAKALASAGSEAVRTQDRVRLLMLAEGFVSNGDLSYVLFTDVTGELLASYQRGAGTINHLFLDGPDKVTVEPIHRPLLLSSAKTGPGIDVVYPVTLRPSKDPMAPPSPTIGYVRLGLSLSEAATRLEAMGRNVKQLAVAIALLMVPLGYEIVRNLVGPLNRLGEAAKSLAAGKLDARVVEKRRDEFGDLAKAFNTMADRLSESHDQLVQQSEELEDRVRQRTTALEEANRQLREVAARDSLTGLYNRRHFNDILGQLFAESMRYNTELTCVMLDLDNFKQVNDTLGHQTGDQLLQLTAEVIKRNIRESDVAVRYGGDEFAILMPQTSPRDAQASAERVLARFRQDVTKDLPEATIASISIGMASRDGDQPQSAKELLNLADEALYLAKAGGKNRITLLCPASTPIVAPS